MAENEDLKVLDDITRFKMRHEDHTKRKVIGIDYDDDLVFDSSPIITYKTMDWVKYSELKQAAIAWVRAMRLAKKNYHGDYGAEVAGLPVSCEHDVYCDYLEQWIMHFFGLTEEDVRNDD